MLHFALVFQEYNVCTENRMALSEIALEYHSYSRYHIKEKPDKKHPAYFFVRKIFHQQIQIVSEIKEGLEWIGFWQCATTDVVYG